MIALRVILSDILAPWPSEAAVYAERLTRRLITEAPPGCRVEGFMPASPDSDYAEVERLLPGLHTIHKSALAHRELAAAWQHGFTRLPGRGLVHAPGLLAPLARHDRLNDGEQVVVTFQDTLAWTHPQLLPGREVSAQFALAKRAVRYADAIVAPSHAVAASIAERLDVGDRVRVVPGGAGPASELPADAAERAAALDLPERSVVVIDTPATRDGILSLLAAGPLPAAVLVVGPQAEDPWFAEATAALPEGAVRALGPLSAEDLAVTLARASVFAHPTAEAGFGMPVLDALTIGTPVVHTDAPALVELSADAALLVPRDDELGARLVAEVTRLLDDPALADRLRIAGQDRASAFTWRSAAEKVWQLHADL